MIGIIAGGDKQTVAAEAQGRLFGATLPVKSNDNVTERLWFYQMIMLLNSIIKPSLVYVFHSPIVSKTFSVCSSFAEGN